MLFGFLALMATLIGSLVVPVVILMIIPGRKGNMRTVREADHPLEMEAAWKLYADRLAFDGFTVDPTEMPGRLVGRRKMRKPPGEEQIVTHATKPMTVEVTFRPIAGGVHATVVGLLNDFVIFDTGEGRQVDLTLHRLMSADLNAEPPPAVPGPSLTAVIAATGAAIALAGPFLARFAAPDSRWRSVGAMIGFALGALYAFSMASQALGEIAKRPHELRGRWIAYLAILLAAAAILLAVLRIGQRMGWLPPIL